MVTTNYEGIKITGKTAKEIVNTIEKIKPRVFDIKQYQVTLVLNPLEFAHIMVALDRLINAPDTSEVLRKEATFLFRKIDTKVRREIVN